MRELRIGLKAPAVGRWQEFLRDFKPAGRNESFYTGAVDNVFGRALRQATVDYQRWLLANDQKAVDVERAGATRKYEIKKVFRFDQKIYQIQPHGRVDVATTLAAKQQGFQPEPEFKMGPDVDVCNDLRESRPYFLIPLPEPPPAATYEMQNKDRSDEDTTLDQQQERAEARARIRAWIRSVYPQPEDGGPRVTDLYIFSHGWHRNFYQAVSAYDRLSSRLARLMRSGRFDDADALFLPSQNENFRPLFLNLHWHSDPGEDDFIDRSGRRDKTSFLEKATLAFDPKDDTPSAGIQMTNDFEDIFALFSRMAAPDTQALSDADIRQQAEKLFSKLDAYQLKDIPEAGLTPAVVRANRPSKSAIAWTCYHEADSRQVLMDQDERPKPFISTQNAILTFGKFVGGLVGATLIGTLIGKLSKSLQWPSSPLLQVPPLSAWSQWPPPPQILLQAALILGLLIFFVMLTGVSYRHGEVPGAKLDSGDPADAARSHDRPFVRQLRRFWTAAMFSLLSVLSLALIKAATLLPTKLVHWWPRRSFDVGHYSLKAVNLLHYTLLLAGALSLAALLCWGALSLLGRRRTDAPKASGRNPLSFAVAFWLPFELAVALPVAFYLLFTYFLGRATSRLAYISNLYNERDGKPNDLTSHSRSSDFRDRLAVAARLPIRLVQQALTRDNSVVAGLDTLDGLLAFYEMQRKGVASGRAAAIFLCGLFNEATELQDATGKPHPKMRIHLVGHSFGALVVVNMTRYMALKRPNGSPEKIHTLCLLEGALASGWFTGENSLNDYVTGSIASIYSRYDTANGFYYPVANNGRMAAGFVGMTGDGADSVQTREHFVLLVEPPKLGDPQYSEDQKTPSDPSTFHRLNLDASRIIYQGPAAVGGGHDDIFKDDVIHLIWAVSRPHGTVQVYIYLDTNDEAAIASVSNSVAGLLEHLGYTLEVKSEPIHGSWFQMLVFVLRNLPQSVGALADFLKNGFKAVQDYRRSEQQHEMNEWKQVNDMLKSLEKVPNAVIQIGPHLIIKSPTVGASDTQIVKFDLTPAQRDLLDNQPALRRKPDELLAMMQHSKTPSGVESPTTPALAAPPMVETSPTEPWSVESLTTPGLAAPVRIGLNVREEEQVQQQKIQ